MEIFGFEITRKKEELRGKDVQKTSARSFVALSKMTEHLSFNRRQVVSYQVGHMVPMLIWKAVSKMRSLSLEDTVKHL